MIRARIARLDLGRDANETDVAPALWKCWMIVEGSIVTSL